MEHFVQFAVSIDDNAITERVEAKAEKEIIDELKKIVQKHLFGEDWYGRPDSRTPSTYLTNRVDAFFKTHEDEIIKMAADRLADKLSRTKKGKEILSNLETNNK